MAGLFVNREKELLEINSKLDQMFKSVEVKSIKLNVPKCSTLSSGTTLSKTRKISPSPREQLSTKNTSKASTNEAIKSEKLAPTSNLIYWHSFLTNKKINCPSLQICQQNQTKQRQFQCRRKLQQIELLLVLKWPLSVYLFFVLNKKIVIISHLQMSQSKITNSAAGTRNFS